MIQPWSDFTSLPLLLDESYHYISELSVNKTWRNHKKAQVDMHVLDFFVNLNIFVNKCNKASTQLNEISDKLVLQKTIMTCMIMKAC